MASEHALWVKTRGVLRPLGGHVERVENVVAKGMPDVNIKLPGLPEFWLELKHAHEWPKRPQTILRIDHWTIEQQQWHLRRHRVGGLSFVLLQVARDYLMYQGNVAASLLGRGTKERLQRGALAVSHLSFGSSWLITAVKSAT